MRIWHLRYLQLEYWDNTVYIGGEMRAGGSIIRLKSDCSQFINTLLHSGFDFPRGPQAYYAPRLCCGPLDFSG